MADQSANLSYAEKVRRQAAEDVARWRTVEEGRLWVAGRLLNQRQDGTVVVELLSTDGATYAAVVACPSRNAHAQGR